MVETSSERWNSRECTVMVDMPVIVRHQDRGALRLDHGHDQALCRRPGGWQDRPMSDADPVWRLVRGEELLAELVVTDADFPWLNARVRPAAGFAGVRLLFDDELRRLEDHDEEPEQWEAAYRSICEVVRLLAPDGRAVAEFLLHIEGENA